MTARQRGWRVPTALVALSVIPVVAGTARLVELAGGPAAIPADARFAVSPLPSSSTSSAPRSTRSSVRSSSPPGSGAGGRGGTGPPAGSSSSPRSVWRCPPCG